MKVWHQHCQPVSEVVHPLVEVAHQVVVEVVTPAERTLHHPRTYPTTVGGTRPTVAVKAVDPSRETSSRVVPSRPWPLPVHRVGAQGFRSVQAAALAVLSRSRTVLLEPAELQLEDAVPAKGATVSAPSVPGVFSDRPVGKWLFLCNYYYSLSK